MSTPNRNCHQGWLRWLAYAKEMTQAEIAAELGVHQTAVSRWVSGERSPREEQWKALARLAGVSIPRYWSGAPGLEVSEAS